MAALRSIGPLAAKPVMEGKGVLFKKFADIDVFDIEPASAGHPLLRLENVITAPHMAGVTRESMDRMAREAVRNVLSVFDGRPVRENVVNPEVLG